MLQTTTTLVETAIVAGSTGTTAKTAVKIEKDEQGNNTAVLVDKKKAVIGTLVGSSATTMTYGAQQASFNNTINNVNAAQAYVQSLSDEELERTLIALDQLDASEVLEAAQQKTK
jgi:hypothetical protein